METTWTTRDGREIPIREMTDSHLENAMRLLERNIGDIKAAIACQIDSYPVQGEMASLDLSNQAMRLYEMEDADFLEEYGPYVALKKEAKRRRIR